MNNQEIKRNLEAMRALIEKALTENPRPVGLCGWIWRAVPHSEQREMDRFINSYRPYMSYISAFFDTGFWWNVEDQGIRLRFIDLLLESIDNPGNLWLKIKLKLGLF